MTEIPAPVQVDGDADAPYYRPRGLDGEPKNFLKAKPQTDRSKCTGCGVCAALCPMGSISREDPAEVTGVCIKCHSFGWDTVQASGKGSVYSFVVMHYPEVPPFDYPNPVGLIELDEGVRIIAGLVGVKRDQIKIGQRVQVEFQSFDDGELILPMFRPVAA